MVAIHFPGFDSFGGVTGSARRDISRETNLLVREIGQTDEHGCRLLLTPNRSLTTRQAYLVYAAISTLVLLVGTICLLLGLPLVLPFSGLEALGLGAGMYTALRLTRREQLVEVAGDIVKVAKRAAGGADAGVFEFQRAWARVVLEQDSSGWYPSKLKLRSHGREIEIGEFLVEEERVALGELLSSRIPPRYASAVVV